MADKNEKEKRPNRLQRWWRETIGELRKVTWPTRDEALRMTGRVFLVMFFVGGFLGLLDRLFTLLISWILGTHA